MSTLPPVALAAEIGHVWDALSRPSCLARQMGAPIKPCSIDLIASPSHRVLDPLWAYHKLYSVFATYGDAFLVVSPWGLYLANASPSVIHQIATRRTDWVKPIEHYAVVEQFGPNVVTTEGSTWREHRKITSGSFNEKSNAVVWKESIRQAQQMIKAWARRNSNGADSAMEVGDVYPDAATTSMHIIGRSGFGVKLLWPGEELEGEDEAEAEGGGYEKFSSHEPRGRYTMTFKESMHTMLRGVIWMGLFSRKWSGRLYLSDMGIDIAGRAGRTRLTDTLQKGCLWTSPRRSGKDTPISTATFTNCLS